MDDEVVSPKTVGPATNMQDSFITPGPGGTNIAPASAAEASAEAPAKTAESVDASKDHADDGGEMVFEGEDTVMY